MACGESGLGFMIKMTLNLYDWQKQIIEHQGDIVAACGRQVGKSLCVSIKAGEYAANNKNKVILVIASVERQAYLLFEKILAYLVDNYKSMIKRGKDRPTKSKVKLKNGSVIYCLPTGLTGYGIRGYTVDLLIADEAAFIPEEVWTAVTPMLATTHKRGGAVILLSTPHGKDSYFYRCFSDPNFKVFHISSEEVPHIDQEWLAREKQRMTALQYAQEYLGQFVEELSQFFPDELIKECMVLKEEQPIGDRFLGVDIARMGSDQSVFVSVSRINKEKLRMFDMRITVKTRLTESIRIIKELDRKYHYKKIYIDTTGLGFGVFDPLLEDRHFARRVVSIENATRALDKDKKRKKKLLKEDLYNNLLWLMESKRIKLLDDPEIFKSLKSVQKEIEDDKVKIFGSYTHITEALIRAAWCIKDKTLNIWAASPSYK